MTVHLRIHTQHSGMLAGIYPEAFQFPGGEWHLRDLPEVADGEGEVKLIADIRGADPNDIVKAALWADVARRWGYKFVLMIPYMPAARADRGEPVGVTVYARLLKSLQAESIIIIDPHSEQTEHSLVSGNLKIVDHTDPLTVALGSISSQPYVGVIAPDTGANKRSGRAAKRLEVPLYHAQKARDFETGELSGFKMIDKLPDEGKLLVVDDICDGGGTFMGLASHLDREHDIGRDRLGLWVTHGIFSGNAQNLRDWYSSIMCTDSHPGSSRLGVATMIVPCFPHMYKSMMKN